MCGTAFVYFNNTKYHMLLIEVEIGFQGLLPGRPFDPYCES
jgi:hypothetical protein